ncbi:CDC48 family AAA ATPase [Candidatus Woesearchaeota archaeon]|nr:CDC48 family AAA ATPase [Candidatus Woesearchaeota archaeon]
MTDKPKKEIEVKVVEAIQDDVNKGIVRIDSALMHEINARPGDIVAIKGKRETVAIVDRAYPGDIGLKMIRMDGIIRRNSGTGIGEPVKVSKADVEEGKKVIVAPSRKDIMIKISNNILKQGLLGRAVIKGDLVSLGGAMRRKDAMSTNPFYDDVFKMFDDVNMGFGFGDLKFIVANTDPKKPVLIAENTEVVFSPEPISEDTIETAMEVSYEDIGGLGDEINKIREMVELPLKHPKVFERLGIDPPKGVLLHGPPGTGKTLLAKAVANETNSNFILINGPEIMSKFYGQSEQNLRKKFEEAEKNSPSIIFIDELDAIATKREEAQGEVEKRVVAQLLAVMDGLKSRGKVVVIAATNLPDSLDPALRRPGRFDREIIIGVPNKEGREDILKIHTRNMPLKGGDFIVRRLAEITHGFVGADLSALCREAAMVVLRRILPEINLRSKDEPIPEATLRKLVITMGDFKESLKIVRPSAMREVLVEIPNIKYSDVGGLEDIKQELKEAVEWPIKNPAAFKRLGVRPPRGILIYGPPGTGKTMIAKAVASESEANFILIKGPELLSKWVGESEKAIRKIFSKARQTAPSIIFFDEIDSLASKRNASSENNVSERVVNQMLTEIDGMEDLNDVVVIAATNRPDMVDTALLRPGRFDRIVYTPAPDEKTRLEIFKVHTKNVPLSDLKPIENQLVFVKETPVQLVEKQTTEKQAIDKHAKPITKSTTKELDLLPLYRLFKNNSPSTQTVREYLAKSGVEKPEEAAELVTKAIQDAIATEMEMLSSYAKQTKGYAGADVESVCREAAIFALREDINSTLVTKEHFKKALDKVRPSVTEDVEKAYQEIEKHLTASRGKELAEEKPAYLG